MSWQADGRAKIGASAAFTWLPGPACLPRLPAAHCTSGDGTARSESSRNPYKFVTWLPRLPAAHNLHNLDLELLSTAVTCHRPVLLGHWAASSSPVAVLQLGCFDTAFSPLLTEERRASTRRTSVSIGEHPWCCPLVSLARTRSQALSNCRGVGRSLCRGADAASHGNTATAVSGWFYSRRLQEPFASACVRRMCACFRACVRDS